MYCLSIILLRFVDFKINFLEKSFNKNTLTFMILFFLLSIIPRKSFIILKKFHILGITFMIFILHFLIPRKSFIIFVKTFF
jgi:hypothetical protein